jgi:hypothetical protein
MKEKIIKMNEYFETSDLGLANSIYYSQYPIEAINNSERRAIFLFLRDKNLDSLIQKYWRHELLIEPIAFMNCLKEVKSQLYNVKQ